MHRTVLAGALLLALAAPAGATGGRPADVEWAGYNNAYGAERFSPLDKIDTRNVATLRPACSIRLGDDGSFQSGMVMVGGTLFVTTAHTTVALDPTNCAERWRHVYLPEEDEALAVNRGVAYLDGRLFRGTADGRIIALDAKSGRELWRVHAGDPKQGEEFTAAPIAWRGLVFLGPAVGEFGMRGRVSAYDAKTGKEVWRFNTVPIGDEPGADSWKIPATTKHGGGGTWTSFTLDPATGELFIPVGNPAPDLLPDSRPGENLYTDSVVVLDAMTGKLRWYHQLVANDSHDWDLGAAPMLYKDAQGQARVALGSKDGHVYVLDRTTHKVVFETAVTTINPSNSPPSKSGDRICPGMLGGVEWNGPAHSPRTKTVYVGAVDWCFREASNGSDKFDPDGTKAGAMYTGGDVTPFPGETATGWVTAIDDRTGEVKWRYHAASPVVAGVTPTAGGLVFAGTLGGSFLAFDAADGTLLKETKLGGALAGGVVTYQIAGQQYVAVTTGNVSRVTFGNGGTPEVVIMKTGLAADQVATQLAVKHSDRAMNASAPGYGRSVFVQYCAACHGTRGGGGLASGPDIHNIGKTMTHVALVNWIENPVAPMPKLFPGQLSDKDVEAVAKYVEGLGSTAH